MGIPEIPVGVEPQTKKKTNVEVSQPTRAEKQLLVLQRLGPHGEGLESVATLVGPPTSREEDIATRASEYQIAPQFSPSVGSSFIEDTTTSQTIVFASRLLSQGLVGLAPELRDQVEELADGHTQDIGTRIVLEASLAIETKDVRARRRFAQAVTDVFPSGELPETLMESISRQANRDNMDIEQRVKIDLLANKTFSEDNTQKTLATEELMVNIEPLIYNFVSNQLRRPSQRDMVDGVEDVVQEILFKVLKALPRYRQMARPFMAFVFSIASKELATTYRAYAKDASLPVEDMSVFEGSGQRNGQYINGHSLELNGEEVQTALRGLSSREVQILFLREGLGYSHEETARTLGLTNDVVRQAYHRALAKARKQNKTR